MGAQSFALKLGSMIFRVMQFAAAVSMVGLSSYFLVYLTGNNTDIPGWVRIADVVAGLTALYTLVAFFLVCCLGGLAIFVFIGIILDIVFACGAVLIAYLTYGGNTNCQALPPNADGINNGTQGSANVNASTATQVCLMYKALFFLSLIAFVLFQLSAIFQFYIGRAHQSDKRKKAEKEEEKATGKGKN